jgi:hypothetical protein
LLQDAGAFLLLLLPSSLLLLWIVQCQLLLLLPPVLPHRQLVPHQLLLLTQLCCIHLQPPLLRLQRPLYQTTPQQVPVLLLHLSTLLLLLLSC